MYRTYTLTVTLGADEDSFKAATMIREQLNMWDDADIHNVTLTYDVDEQGCDIDEDVICGRKRHSPACLFAPDHDGSCSFDAAKEPNVKAGTGRKEFVELSELHIGPYLGLIGTETWNGAEVPYFTLEVVNEIANDLRALTDANPEEIYDIPAVEVVDGLVHVVSMRGSEDEFTVVIEPTRNGLFSVGGHAWRWEQHC